MLTLIPKILAAYAEVLSKTAKLAPMHPNVPAVSLVGLLLMAVPQLLAVL